MTRLAFSHSEALEERPPRVSWRLLEMELTMGLREVVCEPFGF